MQTSILSTRPPRIEFGTNVAHRQSLALEFWILLRAVAVLVSKSGGVVRLTEKPIAR
jgi:hypothetical protein